MTYTKYMQTLLKAWEKSDTDTRVCQVTHESAQYTGVVANHGSIMLLIPDTVHPFSFEALTKHVAQFNGQHLIDGVLSSPGEKAGRTGRAVQEAKCVSVELKSETLTLWVNQKLLAFFPDSAELTIHKSRGRCDMLVAKDGPFLLGLLCPVKTPPQAQMEV